MGKKLEDLVPSIVELFPGKPVETKIGKGFMIGGKADDEDKFYVRVDEIVHELKRDQILVDPDQDESMLDEQEKQLIAPVKKKQKKNLLNFEKPKMKQGKKGNFFLC